MSGDQSTLRAPSVGAPTFWDHLIRSRTFLQRQEERRQNENLLKERAILDEAEWMPVCQRTGLTIDDIRALLQLLQEEYEWPSHHFRPGDNVGAVFDAARYDFAAEEFFSKAARIARVAVVTPLAESAPASLGDLFGLVFSSAE